MFHLFRTLRIPVLYFNIMQHGYSSRVHSFMPPFTYYFSYLLRIGWVDKRRFDRLPRLHFVGIMSTMEKPDNGPSWSDCGPQKASLKILKLRIPLSVFNEQCAALCIQDSQNWAYSGIKSKWPFSRCLQWRTTKMPTVTFKYYLSLIIYRLYILK